MLQWQTPDPVHQTTHNPGLISAPLWPYGHSSRLRRLVSLPFSVCLLCWELELRSLLHKGCCGELPEAFFLSAGLRESRRDPQAIGPPVHPMFLLSGRLWGPTDCCTELSEALSRSLCLSLSISLALSISLTV